MTTNLEGVDPEFRKDPSEISMTPWTREGYLKAYLAF